MTQLSVNNIFFKSFDFDKLYEITRVVTRNLNKIIDINYYPIPEARNSNMRHRPIGIGVQGLADAFIKMRFPFDSPEAKQLNKDIFETIYFAALTESNQMAHEEGSYQTFEGSPASQGILQFDMWNVSPGSNYNWEEMKNKILDKTRVTRSYHRLGKAASRYPKPLATVLAAISKDSWPR